MAHITRPATRTTMPVDEVALLRLMTWLSPAFPTGAFAWSGGLEAAEPDLFDWLETSLTCGSLRNDAVLCAMTMRAGDEEGDVAELAAALPSCAARLSETLEQGAAFLRAVADWNEALAEGIEPCALPVALGRVATRAALPPRAVLTALLQSGLANQVAAAQRLGRIGQREGVRLLARLEPTVLRVAAEAPDLPLVDGHVQRGDRRHAPRDPADTDPPLVTPSSHGPLRIGIGGPVGSGKTTLTARLCEAWRERLSLAVVTNDIYTTEDAEALVRMPGPRLRPHRGRGDRRLPAHRHPRGRLHQPRRHRAAGGAAPGTGRGADRVRRRQPGRHLLAGPRRPDHLRDLGRAGRRHPAQGRAGDHALGPAGDQQDRSRAACRGRSGADAPRRRGAARRAADDLRRPAAGCGRGGDLRRCSPARAG